MDYIIGIDYLLRKGVIVAIISTMKFAVRFILALVISTLLFISPVRANSTFTRIIDRTIIIDNKEYVTVEEVHTLKWNDASIIFPADKNIERFLICPPYEVTEAELESKISNIRVVSKNGERLDFAKSYEKGCYKIDVPYYADLSSRENLTFKLSRRDGSYLSSGGGVIEVVHPYFALVNNSNKYNESTVFNITFKVSKKLGVVSRITPSSKSVKNAGEYTIYSFTQKELVGNFVKITIGNERTVSFKLETIVSGTLGESVLSEFMYNEIEIPLPTDNPISGQRVFFTRIEPFPKRIYTDKNGNRIAVINFKAAQNTSLIIEGFAILKGNKNSIDFKGRNTPFTEIEGMDDYFMEGKYWQVNESELVEVAKRLKSVDSNPFNTFERTLEFVVDHLTYSKGDDISTLKRVGAYRAYVQKSGVCMEYSDLLTTLLRINKIPAGVVYGDTVSNFGGVDKNLYIGHQWVDVWLPTVGWIEVDPTWSSKQNKVIGSDMDHFIWYKDYGLGTVSSLTCKSLDSANPCNSTLKINVTNVDNPDLNSTFTISDIEDKLASRKVSYIETILNSKFGRVLTQPLVLVMISFILFYLLILFIGQLFGKVVKL